MMKININRFGLRFAMVLLLALCAKVAVAENKLYIEPFTLSGNETTQVPLLLDNDVTTATGFNVTIVLPSGLEFAGEPTATERLGEEPFFAFNEANGMLLATVDLLTDKSNRISGNSGAVALIPVRLASGASTTASYSVQLTEIKVEAGDDTWTQPAANYAVTVKTEDPKPFLLTLATTETSINFAPGQTFDVAFTMTNNQDVYGLEVLIEVPEGFTVDSKITKTSRVPSGTRMSLTKITSTSWNFVAANLRGNPTFNGNEGEIFSVSVTAPEDFTANTAEIKFTEISSANEAGSETYDLDDFSLTLVNTGTSYKKAQDEIAALREALTAALAQIAEDTPDVKDQFTGEDITAKIDALEAAVEAAYANGTLTENYDTVMEPAAGIQSDIDALVPAAVEAERQFKNNEAYEAAKAELTKLQDALDAANATIKEEYPAANVTATSDSIQGVIDGIKEAIENAKEAVATEGNFDYTVEAAPVNEAIEAMLADAKAQQEAAGAEAARLAANKAAYDKEIAAIEEAAAAVDAKAAELEKANPGVDLSKTVDALKEQLEAAKTAAADELARANAETDGEYQPTFDGDTFTATADEQLTTAANEYATINGAYNKDIDAIDALLAKLNAAKAEADKNCPAADVTAQYNAALAAIEEQRDAANAALEAAATSGKYENTVDPEKANELIAAMTAEAERQQDNFVKYQEAKATVEALNDMIDEKAAELKKANPDVDLTATVAALKAEVADELKAVNAAYAAVASEGTFKFDHNQTAFENEINETLTNEVARQNANNEAYKAAQETVAGLQAQYDAAMDSIQTQYPDANVEEQSNLISGTLSDLAAAVEEEREKTLASGTFALPVETEPITEAIADMLADAKAQQEAADADAARRAENKKAYEEALDSLAALQAQFDAAKATVAADCPNADVAAQEAEIAESLENLKKAIEEEYAEKLDAGKFEFSNPVDDFKEGIEAYLAEAERQQENYNNYQGDLEGFNYLKTLLAETVAAENEQYKDIDLTAAAAAITAEIDAKIAGATEAYEAVAKEGNYKYDFDMSALENEIKTDIPAEAARQANNNEAYNKAKEELAAVEKQFEDAKATIASEYPVADVTEQETLIAQDLKNQAAALEEEREKTLNSGTFAFSNDLTPFTEAIEAMLEDAEKQQSSADEETQRVAENKKRYDEALAALADLAEKFEEAKAEIAKNDPNANVTEQENMIAEGLADMADALEEHYAAVKDSGLLEYAVPVEDATEAIEALVAEAERQQGNYDAYNKDKATIGTLNDVIDAKVAELKTKYPTADLTATADSLKKAVADELAAAKKAYDDVAEAGTYEFDYNMTALTAGINKALTDEAERQVANNAAYNDVLKEINELQTQLKVAKTHATTIYPNSDVTAPVAAAQALINKAKEDALKALDAVATTGKFDYTVPTEEIETAIAAVLTEAKRQDDNTKAYDAATAKIAELQAKLNAAETAAGTADVAAEVKAAQDAINAATAAADAAKAACATEGTFGYQVPTTEIEALIAAIAPEAARQAANQAAFEAANAQIADLQAKLDAAKATAAKDYANSDVTALVEAAQAAINKATTDAEAAKAACAEEGTFSYKVPTVEIEAAIDAIVPEAKRQADNAKAYDAAAAKIAALQAKLDAAKADVAKNYPDADVKALADAAQAAINEAKADADAAKAAAATAGTFDYEVPASDIEALIAALAPEAARQADNAKAYNAATAELDALEAALEAAIKAANEKYPSGMDAKETKDAIKAAEDAIAAARQDADNAYEAVKDGGKFDYSVDKDNIKDLIKEIENAAAQNGVMDILVEELGGEVRFFNIHGVEVKNPAPGSMVIAVGANGQTKKIIVK